MVEIYHQMKCYGNNVQEILCCSCFYDEVYYLLRQKVDYRNFEEKIEKHQFISFFDGTILVVCNNILEFLCTKRYELSKKTCIGDVIWCVKNRIILCSICTIEIFRKLDILHKFELKW